MGSQSGSEMTAGKTGVDRTFFGESGVRRSSKDDYLRESHFREGYVADNVHPHHEAARRGSGDEDIEVDEYWLMRGIPNGRQKSSQGANMFGHRVVEEEKQPRRPKKK